MSDDLDELADDLAEFDVAEKPAKRSPMEERVIAGFEDIQRFFQEKGHIPQHGENNDIFERLYAVRLEQLAKSALYISLLEPLDHQGLLKKVNIVEQDNNEVDLDDLASELADIDGIANDITTLKHVRPASEIRAAEEIANREKCTDFELFEPLFTQVRSDLKSGLRRTSPPEKSAQIKAGSFFILSGQIAYVANKEKEFKQDYGEWDARLRVIFDNGTESNLLMLSLARAMRPDKDPTSRTISEPTAGPLFSNDIEDGDQDTGTIYVLRSKSDLPIVQQNRDLLHKIGVTGGDVKKRIANASLDPTFLLGEVEVVATYKLLNIERIKLEGIIHKVLGSVRLDIEIPDRFGNMVTPREWFFVPLSVIDQVIAKIDDGTILDVVYDKNSAALVEL